MTSKEACQSTKWAHGAKTCTSYSLNTLTWRPVFSHRPSTCIEFQTTHISKGKWAKQCDSFCIEGYSPRKPKNCSKPTPFYIPPTTSVMLRPLVTWERTDHQTIYIITHQTGPSQCRRPQRAGEKVGHPSAQEPLIRNNTHWLPGLRNEGCRT